MYAAPIPGLRIRGFRTLEDVEISGAGRVNVICGPNNSGKSSLLQALGVIPEILASNRARATVEIPAPVLKDIEDGLVGIPLEFRSTGFLKLTAQQTGRKVDDLENLVELFEEHLGPRIWFEYKVTNGRAELATDSLRPLVKVYQDLRRRSNPIRQLAELIPRIGSQHLQDDNTARAWATAVISGCFPVPRIRSVVDIRRTSEKPLNNDDLWRLVKAASRDSQGKRLEKWTVTLENILKDVFGDVTYAANPQDGQVGNMTLSIDGQVNIPVEQVGAGVREVIAIAFRVLADGGTDVICIEEPENCLHPSAVRRLITSLAERAQVQVFVSTHSAAVINSAPDTVVEITRTEATSTGRTLRGAGEHFRAITAMGHSPADLFLTPCAIWVEGPTDAMYLMEWLAASGLTRGLNYHIGIYGGALGTHISASQEEAAEFLSEIRPISRRCILIADADRKKSIHESLKPHVTRWRSEVRDDADAEVFTTWGRTIENGLPNSVINEIRKASGLKSVSPNKQRFADILQGWKQQKIVFAQRAIDAMDGQIPEHSARLVKDVTKFVSESQI